MARHKQRYMRKCDQCGRVFSATRSDARYCSNACRARAFRTRHRPRGKATGFTPLLHWRALAAIQARSPGAVELVRQIAETYGPDAGGLAIELVQQFAADVGCDLPGEEPHDP